jgi:hypothetical protein
MVLNQIIEELGWPNVNEIFEPSGSGAKVLIRLAQKKLGRVLEQKTGVAGVQVGVLVSDPETSDAPLAVVCKFSRPVDRKILLETHRLAWNFSRSLLLITIEPHVIRKWSCCELPLNGNILENSTDLSSQDTGSPELLPPIDFDPESGQLYNQEAAAALSWVELISGAFFQSHSERFRREKRADHMLLSNLKEVRKILQSKELEDKYIHDLLVRIIFVQFLFDLKDSRNEAALNRQKLQELHDCEPRILSNVYTNLADILQNYDDTYALFKWLGDLFPGVGGTSEEQKAAWEEEKRFVRPEHIEDLADFVQGEMRMSDGQLCLWRQYAFDVIPLEFIRVHKRIS